MYLRRFSILTSLLISGLLLSGASAQTAPLEKQQRAVVLFDIQMDRLGDSEMARVLNLREQIAGTTGAVDPTKLVRIFGIASAPESIDDLQNMQGGSVPVEFSMRMEFKDTASAEEAMKEIAGTSGESFQRNGRTYFRPDDDEAPENMVASQLDGKTIEIGTEKYAFLAEQKQAFTPGLQEAWNRVSSGKDAIRIVIDLEGARELVNQALDLAGGAGDPMLEGFLDVIPGINDIIISMDLSGGNLLGLSMGCKDSGSAQQLNDALAGIFGLAKMFGGQAIGELRQQDAQLADVAQSLLRALSPNMSQNLVEVNIPKPEGMENAIKNAMQNFGMGFGGGFGFDDDF
jgi:hypothetical protein